MYSRDSRESKYEYLIKKCEDVGINHIHDLNPFIQSSIKIDEVYENINDYNLSRKRKNLIVFDNMIAGIMTNRRFQPIIKELFIRCRKLNI